MLMIQLSVRPIEISAGGYFAIDKTLLLTVSRKRPSIRFTDLMYKK